MPILPREAFPPAALASSCASPVRPPSRRVFSVEQASSIGVTAGEAAERRAELASSRFNALAHPLPIGFTSQPLDGSLSNPWRWDALKGQPGQPRRVFAPGGRYRPSGARSARRSGIARRQRAVAATCTNTD